MPLLPETYVEETASYKWSITRDDYNKRVRVDDFYGNVHEVIKAALKKAEEWQCEKLIMKVRNEELSAFIEKGFILEAMTALRFILKRLRLLWEVRGIWKKKSWSLGICFRSFPVWKFAAESARSLRCR